MYPYDPRDYNSYFYAQSLEKTTPKYDDIDSLPTQSQGSSGGFGETLLLGIVAGIIFLLVFGQMP